MKIGAQKNDDLRLKVSHIEGGTISAYQKYNISTRNWNQILQIHEIVQHILNSTNFQSKKNMSSNIRNGA